MRLRLERKIVTAFAVALLFSLLVGIVASWSSGRFLRDAGMVSHTHEVLENLQALSAAWNDAESARRGFVLTPDETLLQTYKVSLENITARREQLKNLMRDNPRQLARLQKLGPIIEQKIAGFRESFRLLEEEQKAQGDPTQQGQITSEGIRLTAQFTTLLNEMVAEENTLLQMRAATSQRSQGLAKYILIGFTLLAVLNLVLGGYFISRDVAARREAERQLELLNGELKSFTYTVSHDIKRPLRGMRGYAGELERKHSAALSDRGRFCVEQIITAADNADALIEDLLCYSRLTADSASKTTVDITRLVEEILRQFAPQLQQKGVQTSVQLHFQTLFCWERGLRQALENLIDNAIKYGPAHGGTVLVSGSETAASWTIAVEDNGIGFDPKHVERVFDLFRRLVPEGQYPGTGAGLAITRKLIEKQGGNIHAASQPGKGSKFVIELPKQEAV